MLCPSNRGTLMSTTVVLNVSWGMTPSPPNPKAMETRLSADSRKVVVVDYTRKSYTVILICENCGLGSAYLKKKDSFSSLGCTHTQLRAREKAVSLYLSQPSNTDPGNRIKSHLLPVGYIRMWWECQKGNSFDLGSWSWSLGCWYLASCMVAYSVTQIHYVTAKLLQASCYLSHGDY